MIRKLLFVFAGMSISLLTSGFSQDSQADTTVRGVLDSPLALGLGRRPAGSGANTTSLRPVIQADNPVQAQKELRALVAEELAALDSLPRAQLEKLAGQGERAAQVVLGTDYAREAAMLTFAPAAANDALGDAVRWYGIAASRGFPGAPSLDQAGVRFYPVRIQRKPHR